MKSFKWCVWLIPNKNHAWNKLTNGFPIHITVGSFLEKNEAFELKNKIDFKPTMFYLENEPAIDQQDDFNALVFYVKPKLQWLPENAHVSFRYSYDQNLNTEITIEDKSALFEKIVVVDCSKHFKYWSCW
jgi:hypothetical protein